MSERKSYKIGNGWSVVFVQWEDWSGKAGDIMDLDDPKKAPESFIDKLAWQFINCFNDFGYIPFRKMDQIIVDESGTVHIDDYFWKPSEKIINVNIRVY